MKNTKKILCWAFLVATLTVIFFASITPNIGVSSKHNLDKILHFSVYFSISIFAYFLANSLRSKIIATFLVFVVAVSTEFFQNFVAGREGSVGDLLANFAGILSAFILVYFLRKIKR